MKTLIIAAAVLTLAGCAHVVHRRANPRMPAYGYVDGRQVMLGGRIDQKAIVDDWTAHPHQNTLTITLDGEPAATGMLDDNYRGEATGKWHGHSVSAGCTSYYYSLIHMTDVRCQVNVDGTHVGEVAF
jgi:hypothetical protein